MRMDVSHRTALAITGVFLLSLLSIAPASLRAAPQTLAEIATYNGSDRQAVLEAGAKKEASLLVYATGTQMEPVRNAFRAKYPFVRLEVYSDGSPHTAQLYARYEDWLAQHA